jgi:hypothetical protein
MTMKKIMTALALTTLVLSSPVLAATRHHSGFVALPGAKIRHGLRPAMNTWHDYAKWGQRPTETDTYARSQDGGHYQRVDSYDVVLNGQIVGRDPDPNIRFQLMREAGFPQ